MTAAINRSGVEAEKGRQNVYLASETGSMTREHE